MATEPKTISQMLESTSIDDADLIEVVKANESNKSLKNQKVTGLTLKSYVGGSGHVIQDAGTPLTQQPNLNFEGATVTNDGVNNATKIVIPSGSKDTIFMTRDGTVSSVSYMNKPGNISTINGTKNLSAFYDCVVTEIYVEFDVTLLTTPGDVRAILDIGGSAPYRDISVNAIGHYSSTNLLSAPAVLSKGDSFHTRTEKQTPLNGTVQNVIIGIILERT